MLLIVAGVDYAVLGAKLKWPAKQRLIIVDCFIVHLALVTHEPGISRHLIHRLASVRTKNSSNWRLLVARGHVAPVQFFFLSSRHIESGVRHNCLLIFREQQEQKVRT